MGERDIEVTVASTSPGANGRRGRSGCPDGQALLPESTDREPPHRYPARSTREWGMVELEVWGAEGRTSFGLGASPVVLGRSDDCDLVLDGDESVSRHHAVLERFGHLWQIH